MQDIHLIGGKVSLLSLQKTHIDPLCAFTTNPEIWKSMSYSLTNREQVQEWCLQRLAGKKEGKVMPFVIVDNATQELIGYTGIFDLDSRNRCGEVGPTWLNPAFFGRKANLEAKLLLLSHGFETMQLGRLQFKISEINERSQKATLKLGAKLEGVLRNSKVRADGSFADYLLYSIIAGEWPDCKEGIVRALGVNER